MKSLIVLSALLILSPNAFAAKKADKSHPCAKMKDACVAAGFTGDHKDGKGLRVDCMDKLSDGVAVAGVTVDAADVAACKKERVQHLEHRKDAKDRSEGNMPTMK